MDNRLIYIIGDRLLKWTPLIDDYINVLILNMKRKDDTRDTFDLDLSDVSHDSASVEFLVSYKCNRAAIDFFRLKVWEEGSTSDFAKLRKLGSSLNHK